MKKEKIIKDLMGMFEQFEDENRELVGELPPELMKQFKKYENEQGYIEHLISLKKKEYEAKFNQMVVEEYGEKLRELQDLKDEFWEEVYTHFNVDSAESYHLDGKTVYRELDGKEGPVKKESSSLH